MRIGFALNSHWAIRLLNWFESRFSVDRPKDYDAQHIRQSMTTMPKIHVLRAIHMDTAMRI